MRAGVTGQRLVDGLKLQWSQCDFNKNIITLIPTKTAKRTGKKVYIPILPQLRKELESIARTDRFVLPDLVTLYDKDKSIITKGIRSIFNDAKLTAHKKTELETGKAIVETGAHSLRHTFVTIARNSSFPDPLIMKITGHTSEEMVDHYTDFNEEVVASLAANLPQMRPSSANGFLLESTPKASIPEWAIEKLKEVNKDNWEAIISNLLKTS